MYLNKIKIQKNIKRFKNRRMAKFIYDNKYFNFLNTKLVYNRVSYIFNRFSLFLELKIYKFFIKNLRRMSKRKHFKSFLNICCNHYFSRKSKNSRMGKGKGKFVRYVYRTISLKPVFTFIRISKKRLIKFTIYLNKKTKSKFICY